MKRFVFALAAFAAFVSPASANIDCQARNLSYVENLICSENDLIELDGEMSRLYFQLRNISTRPEARFLLNNQREWLDERNDCGSTNCLRRAYRARIRALEGVLN